MLPTDPIGFASGDYAELALAAIFLVLAIAGRGWIAAWGERLAARAAWCVALLAALPIVLRLALLGNHPVPVPDIYDEFGHLFVADTLRHWRLANPPHALARFFETFFILQSPTYSSIYPLGQGLLLAAGRAIGGTPWAGVLLGTGAFCGLCCWMLRGWTTPGWALIGGLLAVFEFGPLNQWTNSYWGGALPAAAGCLVFGALPRLRCRARVRDGILLGLGFGMHMLCRPYETVFLALSVALFRLPEMRSAAGRNRLLRPLLCAGLIVIAALGITLRQNRSVTSSWTKLPYSLSQEQYGVPASLTFQSYATPHRELTREQELDYRMQRGFRSREFDSAGTYLQRLLFRVRYYRFYFYAPLSVALLIWLLTIRDRRRGWIAFTILLFALGVNFFPAFQFHYLAAVACLFVLISVDGLRRLSEWPGGSSAARALLYLCIAQFCFFYAAHLFETPAWAVRLRSLDVWDSVDAAPRVTQRVAVNNMLAKEPGKLLVLVRYWPQHIFQDEWVWNEADIDASRVVFARDRGAEEDRNLLSYYPDRRVLLLEPDARPPKLEPYIPEPKAEAAKPAAPAQPAASRPKLVLEQVR